MPKAGDYGCAYSRSRIGFWIRVGQALVGDWSRYGHAFIVVSDTEVIEARPGGAGAASLEKYETNSPSTFSSFPLTDMQRALIVATAESYVGTPYSFIDYLSIALEHWGIRPKFVLKRIKGSKHMICSQLVDQCYQDAGIHLFRDGRWPGDVTPGDLANLLLGAQ
jgi:uncharacterized protein YycO